MSKKVTFTRLLGGVEDLLLDANNPQVVTQNRLVGDTVQAVNIRKISAFSIPKEGKVGDANFVSLFNYLQELMGDKDKYTAETGNGGLAIVSGDSDVVWDGDTPSSNEITLSQKLGNGNYRWLVKTTIGSNNVEHRGKVTGIAGTNSNDFVTFNQYKAVEDTAKIQSDWNATSGKALILNKPAIQSVNYATETTLGVVKKAVLADVNANENTKYVTAKVAKDYFDSI